VARFEDPSYKGDVSLFIVLSAVIGWTAITAIYGAKPSK
jgi:hypothetical protein